MSTSYGLCTKVQMGSTRSRRSEKNRFTVYTFFLSRDSLTSGFRLIDQKCTWKRQRMYSQIFSEDSNNGRTFAVCGICEWPPKRSLIREPSTSCKIYNQVHMIVINKNNIKKHIPSWSSGMVFFGLANQGAFFGSWAAALIFLIMILVETTAATINSTTAHAIAIPLRTRDWLAK